MPKLLNHDPTAKSEPQELVAYAARYCRRHPKGHELPDIAIYVFSASNRTFFDELCRIDPIFAHYNKVKTAWHMQDRYLRRAIDKETVILYKTGFREVTQWTLKNYV